MKSLKTPPIPPDETPELFPAEARAGNRTYPPAEAPAAMVNPVRDIRQLQRHGGATAEELRGFLTQLRGKSPKEMLGAVASSNLVRGTVMASVGTAALLLLATAIPFAFSGDRETGASGDPAEAAEVAPAADRAAEGGAAQDQTAGVEPQDSDQPVADPATAADALGVGEERHAPPDVNPLENAVDDLLRDLE